MTRRRATASALAAATVLATGAARADTRFEWTGNLGAGYFRTDSWARSGGQEVRNHLPAWDALGGLQFFFQPFRPDLLLLDGGVDYNRYQQYNPDGNSASDGLTYQGTARLFGGRELSLELGASRSRRDFTSNLAATAPGSTTQQTERVGLQLSEESYPSLAAAFTRVDSSNENFGSARTTSGTDYLTLAAGQALSSFDYRVGYDTTWARGTFDDLNYRSHQLNVQGTAHVTQSLDLRLSDSWFERSPTTEAVVNPRYGSNGFTSGAIWRATDTVNLGASYSDQRFVLEQLGSPRLERHGQSVSESLQYGLSQEWTALQSLSFDRNEDLRDGTRVLAMGQSLSGGARWARDRDGTRWQVEGTASVGTLEPETGGTFFGQGANLDLSYRVNGFGRRATAGYNVSYTRNLGAQEGWTLAHNLSTGIDVLTARDVRAGLKLDGSQFISDTALFGRTESRSLRLTADGRYRRVGLNASGGLSEGILETVRPSGAPPSFVVPDSLKTRSKFAQLQVEAASPSSGLAGRASVNWLAISTAGRPTLEELGFAGELAYRLGLFTFTVEERYSIGGVNEVSTRTNTIFARVTRTFGSQY